ncbi:MAG: alpha/beta hydrolase [Mangrovicoccus sp.]|nr:alpha/beta hydrolase [Mangrovicoccus sp.]
MLSLKAKFFKSMLRRQVKPALQKLLADEAGFAVNIVRFRAEMERSSARFPTPKDVSYTPWEGQPRAAEIASSPQSNPDWAMLYLHGGGYIFGAPLTHRSLTGFFARNLPAKVYVPDYRLAPEHPFPAAIEDAVAAYQALLHMGYGPHQIVVAGDSAGGGLSLAMCLKLREMGIAQPCAMGLVAPYTDLLNTRQSVVLNAQSDDMFVPEIFGQIEHHYYGTAQPEDPLISPIYGDLSGLPPMIVHASSSEILLDDSLRLAARVRQAGGQVDLQIMEGLPHVWHVLCGLVPEADRDALRMALFLRGQLQLAELP